MRSAKQPFTPESKPKSWAGPNNSAPQATSHPITRRSPKRSVISSRRRNFSVISFGNLLARRRNGIAPSPYTKTRIAPASTLRRAACRLHWRTPHAMMDSVTTVMKTVKEKASGVSDSSANAPTSTAAHFPTVTRCSMDGDESQWICSLAGSAQSLGEFALMTGILQILQADACPHRCTLYHHHSSLVFWTASVPLNLIVLACLTHTTAVYYHKKIIQLDCRTYKTALIFSLSSSNNHKLTRIPVFLLAYSPSLNFQSSPYFLDRILIRLAPSENSPQDEFCSFWRDHVLNAIRISR